MLCEKNFQNACWSLRFTYDGTKELFRDLDFEDSKGDLMTRKKDDELLPLKYPLPQLLSHVSMMMKTKQDIY